MMKVMGDGDYPKLEKPWRLEFAQENKIFGSRRNSLFNEERSLEASDS